VTTGHSDSRAARAFGRHRYPGLEERNKSGAILLHLTRYGDKSTWSCDAVTVSGFTPFPSPLPTSNFFFGLLHPHFLSRTIHYPRDENVSICLPSSLFPEPTELMIDPSSSSTRALPEDNRPDFLHAREK
jgi:hypothetical protein